jgi:hypothetical protein
MNLLLDFHKGKGVDQAVGSVISVTSLVFGSIRPMPTEKFSAITLRPAPYLYSPA